MAFVEKRIEKLAGNTPRRIAALLPLTAAETPQKSMAITIAEGASCLHDAHCVSHDTRDKKISLGLVRMANINPLVAVARELAQIELPKNTEINICVYHARHPLLRRHLIEKNLDGLLQRSDPALIWRHEAIKSALNRKAKNQIFIVLATAVAEVGRDHCYDWAIVEPSSMRSIVQLAGRILRHREPWELTQPNMLLLEKNFKGLQGIVPCFNRPGYESDTFTLDSHELTKCLPEEHFLYPSPRSCISESSEPDVRQNMVDMEHAAIRAELLTNPESKWPASLWWLKPVRWAYQMQYRTRFRKGPPTQLHALVTDYRDGEFSFERLANDDWGAVDDEFTRITVDQKPGIYWWITPTDQQLMETIPEEDDFDIEYYCRTKLTVDLEKVDPTTKRGRLVYHEILGLFRSL